MNDIGRSFSIPGEGLTELDAYVGVQYAHFTVPGYPEACTFES